MHHTRENGTIGLFTTGLAAYWPQMPGILEEILGYAGNIARRLSSMGKVVNEGMVDTLEKARHAEETFLKEDVDIIIIHAGTYGNSQNILHAIRRCRVPVITLHLQPDITFDNNASTLHTMPKNPFSIGGEITAVLHRSGILFETIAGRLTNDERPWKELGEWIDAVRIVKSLRKTNLGLLGHVFSGMYDLSCDYARLSAIFGINVEMLEMATLRRFVDGVTPEEIDRLHAETRNSFVFDPNINEDGLTWCVRVAAGMERMIADRHIHGLSFQFDGYPDSVEEKVGYSLTLGGCLLNAKNIPCTAEGDIPVTLAMRIFAALGVGSTQAELNIIDFDGNVNYVNHSGPGNIALAGSKPLLRWLDFFHGKRGSGVSSEFSVRPGPITLFSITASPDNEFMFVVARGEAVEGFRLPNGNMNTRVHFPAGPAAFFEKWTSTGPTHHAAMAAGDHLSVLKKCARALGCGIKVVE